MTTGRINQITILRQPQAQSTKVFGRAGSSTVARPNPARFRPRLPGGWLRCPERHHRDPRQRLQRPSTPLSLLQSLGLLLGRCRPWNGAPQVPCGRSRGHPGSRGPNPAGDGLDPGYEPWLPKTFVWTRPRPHPHLHLHPQNYHY